MKTPSWNVMNWSTAEPIHLLSLQIYFAYHLGWCHAITFLDTFITERIEKNNIDFYALIKKNCLRNFTIVTCAAKPENCPQKLDGMVLLQKLPKILKTFGDISDYLLMKLLDGSTRVAFFVTDYYLEDSIKSMERDSRSAYGTIRKWWEESKWYQRSGKNSCEIQKTNWTWLILFGMTGRQIWNTFSS